MLKRWLRSIVRVAALLLPAACNEPTTAGAIEATTPEPRATGALRVVTFNTWMVPFRDRASLTTRIAEAVGELDADVVALQEVWRDEDGRALATALNRRGYPWVQWRASDGVLSRGSAGLLIASRHPLSQVSFTPFRAGKLPLVLWQPDWFSGKGFLSVDVETPSGVVRVVTTHAQADYSSNDYGLVRLSHMLQLGRAVSDTPVPLIVAGDLNVRRGEIGHEALLVAARLSELERAYGVDGIYFRGSDAHSLREVSSERVLGGDGHGRLSDHHGVLAVLELLPEAHTEDSRNQSAIVSAIADHERRIWHRAGAALIAALAAAVIVRRLRAGSPSLMRIALLLGVGCVGLWCFYYAVIYAPAEARWLARAADDLASR